ncbi:ovostatin-like isoform X2 [Engystomops pustulosus]|uniref:ovostatin-like isoform X2 n=1 Tax=Engystomops pustulosus TaxID=76066 RepID=UPI003AFB0CBA
MTVKSLVLTALLLGLLAAGSAQLHYALSIPANLNSGEVGKACMNLQGYSQVLQLSVVLQYSAINTTIFTEKVSPPRYFKCNTFQVPVVLNNVPVLVLLSVSGEGVQILRRYSVVVTVVNNIYLVQMDKPIYKPGQKVLFNLVALNQLLLPVDETDPSGSRLAQWLNQKSKGGLVSLEFPLINDAAPGYYLITAERASENAVTQSFSVEEYVLPRFDMTLDAPNSLSILDKTLKFNVSAMYTYGEPVPGTVSVRWCRQPNYGRLNNCFMEKNGVCFSKTGKLASDGSFNELIDLTTIQMDRSGAQTNLNLSVTVIEDGTGVQVTKTQYLWVTSQLASITFDYDRMNQYYKRGLQYTAVVLLRDEKGRPMVGEEVELNIDDLWRTTKIKTDSTGAALYEIDTSNFLNPNYTIQASYPNTKQCYYRPTGPDYPVTQYTFFRFYSATGSFLQIISPRETLKCGQNQNIVVQFLLSTDGVGVGATKATFYYLTMSRARIVHTGQQDVALTNAMKGNFSFNLPITSEMALRTNLIVYTILRDELIADTKSLMVEACFKNKVSLDFAKRIGLPASDVDLQISASPGSLCAVKVIDSSLILLHPDNGLTAEGVYNSLQDWFSGYTVEEINLEEPAPPCEDPRKQIFYSGNYYVPVSSYSEGDTYQNLKNMGLIVGTDVRVRKPEVCGQEKPALYPKVKFAKQMAEANAPPREGDNRAGAEAIETVRRNFSDTWVWTMVTADSKGQCKISQKVPDTITEWIGSMICTSEKDGFGMTNNPSEFTTFLPFFVEMSLPYSFVRGETLVLGAFVSNYLDQCVKVQVSLSKSRSFTAVPQEGKQDACICKGQRASYTWNINANSIGVLNFTVSAQTTFIGKTCDGRNDASQPPRKDTVIQSVIVEAEGIKKEETSSNLICFQGKTPSTLSLTIKLIQPQNVVPGSASGFLTVIGDIIGLPLQNLQNLLQMPYGCGEQNLARMAPIPDLLDYLNVTGQLTDEILQRAIQYMNTGYYRQLRFKVWSGAYSLFGDSNIHENSWLTAYVFKTFERCKKYIYIDANIQQQTLLWLANSQKLESGCFRAAANHILTRKEGEDNDLIYTAYLAIALLESNYSLGRTLLDGTMACLRNAFKTDQSLYNRVLMLYAFTLSGDWHRRSSLLKLVKSKAISAGGTTHWEREGKPGPVEGFSHLYSPADVEITAYILLSLAKGMNIDQAELSYMSQISVWLIRQQNSYGGFRSTQDTVMALQALSAFAKLVFMANAQHNIQVTGQDMQTFQITLNKDNRLLVQKRSLSVPGDYSVTVTGTGCCLVQSTIRYNVPVPQQNSAFLLKVQTSSSSCTNGVAYTFNINILVSYRGTRPQTSMAIIDITMLSGYQADYWSLQELVKANVISYSETNNNHVILYLNSVTNETMQLSFNVVMGTRVLNVKTASVYVYDYYETAENGYTSYQNPCA